MNLLLKIVLAGFTIIYLLAIIINVKNNKLNSYVSIFWLMTGFGLLILLLIPNLVESIAKALGFSNTSDLIYCLTIFLAFYLLFISTMRISENYNRSIKLTQKVGLLEKQIRELEEKIKDEKSKS